MRYRFPCVLLAASQFLLAPNFLGQPFDNEARGDDPLFSEIAMESVFAKSVTASPVVATKNDSADFGRITGPSSLATVLKSSGFEPKQDKESVSFVVARTGWKLPVAMKVDVQQDQISCHMSLTKIDPDASLSSETILSLMAASNQAEHATFVYDDDRKMIQLRCLLSNRDVTMQSLQDRMTTLADIAIANSVVWMALKTSPTLTSISASRSPTDGKTLVSQASVLGRWGASLPSNASIAIEFSSNGTFKMAHVAGKQSAISSGTVQRESNRLTLSETGKPKVVFQIDSVTATAMELRLIDTAGKSGLLIKFTKVNP
ncbi:hypothetical protein [Rubripirellula reticaptiva]|uniref:Uncharacterized protein n=1 Tax=Rubripirellula reticaptiva TaxID=2528013 RepID=A0A5C6EU40_9BACT|nr:hypothetical protein [Rubripirellula reticaptiva]TWU51627.1 hypothetical protein Poly59_32210 [Rubripirellula reticaptiva]